MKKTIWITIIMVFCTSLVGCNYDLYSDKRPFDYGAARWVCEDPVAWFDVVPEDPEHYRPKGEIQVDGVMRPCTLYFINGTNQLFITLADDFIIPYDDYALDCICDFSPEKMEVTVTKDTIFSGQYDTLIFVKTPAQTETSN